MSHTVPAADLSREFGRIKNEAEHGAVAVLSEGEIAGYFVSRREYEALQTKLGRWFRTQDMTQEHAERIFSSDDMHPRHNHLDQDLVDPK